MADPIQTLRHKLEELAHLDPQNLVFGTHAHRYRLGPTLSEDRMSGIERDYGVRLPDGYRRFLTEMGHGGAGPYYGLFKLATGDRGATDSEDMTDYERLAKPFRYKDATKLRWQTLPGALYICHQGCALRTFVVVTGPCRGEVWNDLRADGGLVSPALGANGERLHFFSWYEKWLDESLAKVGIVSA